MAPTRKKVSLNGIASGAEEGLRDLVRFDRFSSFYSTVRAKMKNLPKTNYDLGYTFAGNGRWMDAIFRFKVVLYLAPDYPNANYNLGCCYMRVGKNAEARAAFLKALKQTPGNPEVTFMLASLDASALPASQQPTRMPADMVTGFFTQQAEGYDITEANNKYQAGKIIHDFAKPLVKTETPVVLDLGCGSGIAARPWRAAAATVRGVDVTPAMLVLAEKATHAEKKLFDTMSTADVVALTPDIANSAADVVLLVNVVQFIGELTGTISSAARALRPGGVLVITTEPYAEAGYGLVSATSRFGHSNSYVKQVAAAAGLTPVAEQTVELYAGVPAQALAFTKGTN